MGENTRDQRLRYKSALVETLRRDGGDFHVVAQLRAGASRAALEDALYAWVARVNRFYLGRSWSAPHRAKDRMKGVVFFETSGGFHHAHLVVRRPATASSLPFTSCSMRDSVFSPILLHASVTCALDRSLHGAP